MSLRERPTLPVVPRPMKSQAYFKYLEFDPPSIRSLQDIEMIAEKLRAAYQRAKIRDLYDLHRFAATPFDSELLRGLLVLKLWQVQDPFVPDVFFERLRGGDYDWDDLRRLITPSEHIDQDVVVRTVESRFAFLRDLSELELQVVGDAKGGWNTPLGGRLRQELLRRLRGLTAEPREKDCRALWGPPTR